MASKWQNTDASEKFPEIMPQCQKDVKPPDFYRHNPGISQKYHTVVGPLAQSVECRTRNPESWVVPRFNHQSAHSLFTGLLFTQQ